MTDANPLMYVLHNALIKVANCNVKVANCNKMVAFCNFDVLRYATVMLHYALMHEFDDSLRRAVRRKERAAMTPEEFAVWLKTHSVTAQVVALAMRIDKSTVSRYLSGHTPIPLVFVLALQRVYDCRCKR